MVILWAQLEQKLIESAKSDLFFRYEAASLMKQTNTLNVALKININQNKRTSLLKH